jgi:hypothetical protein
MWMLESLSETPFQKPFTLLALTLGAAFLLLAFFFHLNPIFHPIIYVLAALDLALLWNRKQFWIVALLAAVTYALAYVLLPAYVSLFVALFTLTAGRMIFPTTFKIWKSLAAAAMLTLSVYMVLLWEQSSFLTSSLPAVVVPLLHGTLFAFLLYCSFVVFVLKQNRVTVAMQEAVWEKAGEAVTMALHARGLYDKLRVSLPDGEEKARASEELEVFTAKVIRLCYNMQELSRQNAQNDPVHLEREMNDLQKKIEETRDSVAGQQYKKALFNKEKQKEQHQRMMVQEERCRAQVLNYVSALENLQYSYAHHRMNNAGSGRETIDFFLHIAEVQAENQYQSSEAYQHLANS